MALAKKALIFDLDGTLIDSSEAVLYQLRALVSEFGTQPRGNEDLIHAVHASGGSIHRLLPMVLGEQNEAALKRIHGRHSGLLTETRHLLKPYTGVIEALDALSDRYQLAIFTSRPQYMLQDAACEVLLPYFAVLVSLEHVTQPKPHPEGVLLALERLGVSADQAIMIGDTSADVASGKAAGVSTVAITHGFEPRASLNGAGADKLVDSFPELVDWLIKGKK